MKNYIVKKNETWSNRDILREASNINSLIKLVIEYKANSNDKIFDKIVIRLNKLINSYIYKVDKYYRDDLKQELLLGIYKTTQTFKIDNNIITEDVLVTPGTNHNVINFISRYGKDLLISSYCNAENFINFKDELILFCNENQYIHYLSKTFRNIYIDYLKMNYYQMNNLLSSFDENIHIDYALTNNSHNHLCNQVMDIKRELDKEDLIFIELFVEDNKSLTEKEVGIKLGISQQAVNKRKKAIYKKYHNKISL